MIDHVARLNLIRDNFQAHLAALPMPAADRFVSRSWKPLQNWPDDKIKAGVYTFITRAESEFPNYNGAEAEDGKLRLLLIGCVQLPEDATGEDIENTELRMFDNEVAPWLRNLPQELCCLVVKVFTLSGQLAAPFAQAIFELEECTS